MATIVATPHEIRTPEFFSDDFEEMYDFEDRSLGTSSEPPIPPLANFKIRKGVSWVDVG